MKRIFCAIFAVVVVAASAGIFAGCERPWTKEEVFEEALAYYFQYPVTEDAELLYCRTEFGLASHCFGIFKLKPGNSRFCNDICENAAAGPDPEIEEVFNYYMQSKWIPGPILAGAGIDWAKTYLFCSDMKVEHMRPHGVTYYEDGCRFVYFPDDSMLYISVPGRRGFANR